VPCQELVCTGPPSAGRQNLIVQSAKRMQSDRRKDVMQSELARPVSRDTIFITGPVRRDYRTDHHIGETRNDALSA